MYEAIAEMANRNVGSLIVLDDDRLVGIITERHYARNIVLKAKTSLTTPVRHLPRDGEIDVGQPAMTKPSSHAGVGVQIATE